MTTGRGTRRIDVAARSSTSDVYRRGASGWRQALFVIEAVARALTRGAVHPHIGDVLEPELPL